MFSVIKKWGGFVRFSHTVFALPFALAAMMVAARDNRGWPGWKIFGLILAAMVCARTCAMAFNRIVDRKFDALNPRTANRHLPTGQISLASAILLCAISGGGLGGRQLFSQFALFLPFAGRAGGDLFLFADQTVHGLHARFSRHRAGARAGRRVAGGERRECFRSGNFANDHARARRRVVARRLRHHLRAAGLRVRQIARPAFARRGVGAEKRAGRRVSRAHGHVRAAARVRAAVPVSHRVCSSAGSSSSAASCWNTGLRAAAV